jgi:hypothetical protein
LLSPQEAEAGQLEFGKIGKLIEKLKMPRGDVDISRTSKELKGMQWQGRTIKEVWGGTGD